MRIHRIHKIQPTLFLLHPYRRRAKKKKKKKTWWAQQREKPSSSFRGSERYHDLMYSVSSPYKLLQDIWIGSVLIRRQDPSFHGKCSVVLERSPRVKGTTSQDLQVLSHHTLHTQHASHTTLHTHQPSCYCLDAVNCAAPRTWRLGSQHAFRLAIVHWSSFFVFFFSVLKLHQHEVNGYK